MSHTPESSTETETPHEYSSLNISRTQNFLDQPIGSFKGPNSLHHFASSFTRAQSYQANKLDNEIHKKRSFFHQDPDGFEDETFDPELMVPSMRGERLSSVVHDINLARNSLFTYGVNSSTVNNDVFYQDDIINALNSSRSRTNSVYTNVGITIDKRRIIPAPSFSSIRSSISGMTTADHLIVKKIEDENGRVVTVLEGQSTAPQTIFNSVNVLIGVGLLALPVGILKAGVAVGFPILLACGFTTYWSATLLSKAMDTDSTIMTYADLGYASYGSIAKLLISVIFSVDLMGAGVALVVLFSDSLYALLGNDTNWTKPQFKILGFVVLTPFTFMPLLILSIFSLLGIISTISITILVLVCGVLKQDAPGSLIQTMPLKYYPNSYVDLLLAIGILMAPFGGHAIFPNLKSDMRHPFKFTKTLITTYSISLLTDSSMAVLGVLMFGKYCNNEITNNLLSTSGYPSWIYPLLSGLICLVPIAKTPLNAKPIVATLDSFLLSDSDYWYTKLRNNLIKVFTRIGVNAVFVFLAILFPEFDKIIGILGASICFLICIILPCCFYLKLVPSISNLERFIIYLTLIITCGLAVSSTWAVVCF